MFSSIWINGYKTFLLDQGSRSSNPLFLMFCFQEEEMWNIVKEVTASEKELSLALVLMPDWDSRMVPFDYPKMKIVPRAQETSAEISSLLSEIEKECASKVSARYLIGYSLGGLYAVYEGLKGHFDGFASVSGSMWYPGIKEYVEVTPLPSRLRKAYFSIGDKESGKPSSPFFEAREKMIAVKEALAKKGLPCRFDLNSGGHFDHPEKRLMASILSLLGEQS